MKKVFWALLFFGATAYAQSTAPVYYYAVAQLMAGQPPQIVSCQSVNGSVSVSGTQAVCFGSGGPVQSPNGTTIPTATSIIDAAANTWTVVPTPTQTTATGVIYQNGTTAGFSANVALLLYYNTNIYQENASYNWYEWNPVTLTYTASSDPRTTAFAAPNAPFNVSATAGNASATVAYSRPFNTGGGTVTYTATSTPGAFTGTGTSPITVSGLTNGTPYTFTVKATNSMGSATSSASNSVTPTGSTALSVRVAGNNIINGSGTKIQLRGVNVDALEGLPFSNGDMWRGQPPNFSAMKNNWGVNVVRLPLGEANWLGLCPTTISYGVSPANYQSLIQTAVNQAAALGIYIILDLHWIVDGSNTCPEGQNAMADSAHSPTFWSQVATAYKNQPNVMFELFNEPQGNCPPTAADFNNYVNGQLSSSYDTNTQTLLNAIRATGATNVVLVDTLNYGSTFGYETNPICGGGSTSYGFTLPTDSLHQIAAVQHYYHGNDFETGANYVLNQGIPILADEYGASDGSSGDASSLYGWADPGGRASQALSSGGSTFPGVSYVAWTWNFGYGGYSLITNSAGTNAGSAYSSLVQSHYLCRAAGTC